MVAVAVGFMHTYPYTQNSLQTTEYIKVWYYLMLVAYQAKSVLSRHVAVTGSVYHLIF